MTTRTTLARPVSREGVGIHTGEAARVILKPARFGSGVVFVVNGRRIPATARHARAGLGCTRLEAEGQAVLTPEHLLAALHGLGVTDVEIELMGREVPVLDGSASQWIAALDDAGRIRGPALQVRGLTGRSVEGFGGRAWCGPGPDTLSVHVDFGLEGPVGTFSVIRNEEVFRSEVSWARTFVRACDVEAFRRAGRGRGVSDANTVIWPGSQLRSTDEPVRHKLLDLWGDLALLGRFQGQVTVERGSHALHHMLIGALLEQT